MTFASGFEFSAPIDPVGLQNFSPAATACGRVARPVIPVAPNIATFVMESDISPRFAEILLIRHRSGSPVH